MFFLPCILEKEKKLAELMASAPFYRTMTKLENPYWQRLQIWKAHLDVPMLMLKYCQPKWHWNHHGDHHRDWYVLLQFLKWQHIDQYLRRQICTEIFKTWFLRNHENFIMIINVAISWFSLNDSHSNVGKIIPWTKPGRSLSPLAKAWLRTRTSSTSQQQ